ncbi:hypothetical protein RRG08_052239 [Elysia crispata]|uniref:Uncharacterized protein n=1 Tax=Elysia crispata TaxID=231223 RepID=A0AAE1AYX2_9GAST|nr:hypothetical protein RRG08_052239 [Elysia crispata]
MGLSETINISFFSLSISDLLVSQSAVLVQSTYTPRVSTMKKPSGALVGEIGIAVCYIMFPCMGCSAWITAILSAENSHCIPTLLKEIVMSSHKLDRNIQDFNDNYCNNLVEVYLVYMDNECTLSSMTYNEKCRK